MSLGTKKFVITRFDPDRDRARFVAVFFKPFEDESEMVEGMGSVRINRDAPFKDTLCLGVGAQFKERLPFESTIESDLPAGLCRSANEKECAFEIVLVEESLALEVIDFRLKRAIGSRKFGPSGKQLVC